MRHGTGWLAWTTAVGIVLNVVLLCPSCPTLAFVAPTCGAAGCATACGMQVACPPPTAPCAPTGCCGPAACDPIVETDDDAPPADDQPIPLCCLLLCLQFGVDRTEMQPGDDVADAELLLPVATVVAMSFASATLGPPPAPIRGSPARRQPLLCVWRN